MTKTTMKIAPTSRPFLRAQTRMTTTKTTTRTCAHAARRRARALREAIAALTVTRTHDFAPPFDAPADARALPDYERLVARPLDLRTIATRAADGFYRLAPPDRVAAVAGAIATAPHATDPDAPPFREGDRARCALPRTHCLLPGRGRPAHAPDGGSRLVWRFDVNYDDGDREKGVVASRMRAHDPNAPDTALAAAEWSGGAGSGTSGGAAADAIERGAGGALPLVRDVLTVFHNCRLYFEPTSALSRMADARSRGDSTRPSPRA